MVETVSEHPGTCLALTRCSKLTKCWDGSDQDMRDYAAGQEVAGCWEERNPLRLLLRGCAIDTACQQKQQGH